MTARRFKVVQSSEVRGKWDIVDVSKQPSQENYYGVVFCNFDTKQDAVDFIDETLREEIGAP